MHPDLEGHPANRLSCLFRRSGPGMIFRFLRSRFLSLSSPRQNPNVTSTTTFVLELSYVSRSLADSGLVPKGTESWRVLPLRRMVSFTTRPASNPPINLVTSRGLST